MLFFAHMFYVFYVDVLYFISYARHMKYYHYACVIICLYIRKYIYTYTYLLQDSSCKINYYNNQFNILARRSLSTPLWTPNGSLSLGSYRAEAKGVIILSAVVPPGPASCSAESSSRLHPVFGVRLTSLGYAKPSYRIARKSRANQTLLFTSR